MSISSYRRNVSRGVTGKYTNTCFPAALEQVSPGNRLEPRIYRKYERFINWHYRLEGQDKRQYNPAYKDMLADMAWGLGEVDFDDIEFDRAETYKDFSRIVRQLIRHEYRVSVEVVTDNCLKDESHALGIIAVGDDYYRMASTWVPRALHGYVGLRQVFEEVITHKDEYRERYPFHDANITALPPAA